MITVLHGGGVSNDYSTQWQNYTLLEQKGIISSIIDEIIKFEKT